MLHEAGDFLQENEIFDAFLSGLSETDWEQPTQFKNWTVNDIVVHLHFWNKAADLSLTDSTAFTVFYADVKQANSKTGIGLRNYENQVVGERGIRLRTVWRDYFRDMAGRWLKVEPKTRVKWAGPDMSVRSSISARQMETWAHAQAVFDLFGKERQENDRIRNIVFLGINTFQWSFKNRGMEPPATITMPRLKLYSPSGELWTFGDEASTDLIEGSAVEFCQVNTQTRSFADTSLKAYGETARSWMQHAQCFAGAAQPPPSPGSRYKT